MDSTRQIERPATLEVEFDSIPEELKARPQHVLWKIITRGGQPTKTPSNPNTGGAGESQRPSDVGYFRRPH